MADIDARPLDITRPAPLLARALARLGIGRAQGAPEGETIGAPVARVEYPTSGWLPMNWGVGWWQAGHNILSGGENPIVEACVWA